jgi:glycosyltransferase involved in cell wall biosynthesis
MEVAKLGALTVSTLSGEHGRQRKELEKLVRWLKEEAQPEVVHLSNALLLGMARRIREELKIPIVCGLAGEDWFLEQLREPHYDRARQLLRERAAEVDRFVAYNNYFADFMADYLNVERKRIEVIHHGLDLNGHGVRSQRVAGEPFTIGYFGRVAPEKGLHVLIDAFAQLCGDQKLPLMRLRIAGYKSAGDESYFASLQKRVNELGLIDRFEYAGELDRASKIEFLQSLDVMGIPTIYHESKGLSALEAMANAVPLVAPRHGAFPELIEQTGAGLLCEPENPADMAAKLREYVAAPTLVDEHGSNGKRAIFMHYSAARMAEEHRSLYRRLHASADFRR